MAAKKAKVAETTEVTDAVDGVDATEAKAHPSRRKVGQVDHQSDYTVAEVAVILRTSVPSVWALIREGRLHSYSLSGKSGAARRIRADVLEIFRLGADPNALIERKTRQIEAVAGGLAV